MKAIAINGRSRPPQDGDHLLPRVHRRSPCSSDCSDPSGSHRSPTPRRLSQRVVFRFNRRSRPREASSSSGWHSSPSRSRPFHPHRRFGTGSPAITVRRMEFGSAFSRKLPAKNPSPIPRPSMKRFAMDGSTVKRRLTMNDPGFSDSLPDAPPAPGPKSIRGTPNA